MTSAYERINHRGVLLDRATSDALKVAEDRLGYELTVYQGIGGAAASSGTHLDGRAVDLSPWDWEKKMRVLKEVGFAIWRRKALAGVWSEHLHGCLILDSYENTRGIAPSAFRQIQAYRQGRNGLANNGPDETPWRAVGNPVFKWPVPAPPRPEPTNVQRARRRLNEARGKLEQAVELLNDADESRVVARNQRDDIREIGAEIGAIVTQLPKR